MTATQWGIGMLPQHQAKLESSGITPEVADARRVRSVEEYAALERLGFSKAQRIVPGMLLPLHDVRGRNAGFQYRPDHPRQRNGKPVKYETRLGDRMVIDVHPSVRSQLADPSVPLWITEGPLKGDSAVTAGLCCVDVLGVWNWRGTNTRGGTTALADFEEIALNDREIILAFDSDSMTKVSVYDALVRLAAFLERRGAKVRYLHLPDSPEGKTGLDDALAAGTTPAELLDLVDTDPGERPSPPASEPVGPDGLHLTDTGNAERLVAAHGDLIRYVPTWLEWLIWDGVRFQRDPGDVQIGRLAGDVPRRLWELVPGLGGSTRDSVIRWATKTEGRAALANLVHLARSIPGVAVRHDELNSDRWLLNVENGILDLRTGELLDHDPDRLITRLAPVRWEPDAAAPAWTAFLERVLRDEEVRSFVQKAFGYSLTGDVSEQVLFVLIGVGANGKSTLVSALRALLGDYAVTAPKDLLLAGQHEPHPTSMTELYEVRFAAAVETEQGSKLAEAQVKRLTGGDEITARRMRENFWSFLPTHKLWLAANHRPRIHGRDLAMWRRVRLIPFDVIIPPDERDPHLGDRLLEELPGILAWAVEGCRRWQVEGLEPPAAIAEATEEYRVEEDWFLRFIEDSDLMITPGQGMTARAVIYDLYLRWCKNEGVPPVSGKALADELQKNGVEGSKTHGNRAWKGIWKDGE